jgi:hypothetical protein
MWWDDHVLELMVLGVAGLLAGAALGSRKNGAPMALTIVFLLLAAVAAVLAVALLLSAREQ